MTTSTSRRSSSSRVERPSWSHRTRAGTVRVLTSVRADGDFHLDRVEPGELEQRRRRVVDLPWTMLDERHGTDVVTVDHPGDGDRRVGDVLVGRADGAALGVWVGDCAPVIVVAPSGDVAAVHAGWRGLAAGVLDVACDALGLARGETSSDNSADDGARPVAHLGPCIGSCCYEFGASDLADVARGVGADVATVTARTRGGALALDVRAAVRAALAHRGVQVDDSGICTGCHDQFFSHRVRRDRERHVVVAWRHA